MMWGNHREDGNKFPKNSLRNFSNSVPLSVIREDEEENSFSHTRCSIMHHKDRKVSTFAKKPSKRPSILGRISNVFQLKSKAKVVALEGSVKVMLKHDFDMMRLVYKYKSKRGGSKRVEKLWTILRRAIFARVFLATFRRDMMIMGYLHTQKEQSKLSLVRRNTSYNLVLQSKEEEPTITGSAYHCIFIIPPLLASIILSPIFLAFNSEIDLIVLLTLKIIWLIHVIIMAYFYLNQQCPESNIVEYSYISFAADLFLLIPFCLLPWKVCIILNVFWVHKIPWIKHRLSNITSFGWLYLRLSRAVMLREVVFWLYFVFLYSHVMSCLWIHIGKSTMYDLHWIEDMDLRLGIALNDSPVNIYVTSLYYHMSIITTTGFGDVLPVNALERIYTALFMGASLALISYVTASIVIVLQGKKADSELRSAKMNALTNFMSQLEPHTNLQYEITRHFNFKWMSMTENAHAMEILDEMNDKLRLKCAKIMFGTFLEKIPLMQQIRRGTRRSQIIHAVLESISVREFDEDDLICQKGQKLKYWYILRSGEVAYFTRDFPCLRFNPGATFGELEYLEYDGRFQHSIRAIAKCSILLIPIKKFARLLRKNMSLNIVTNRIATVREVKLKHAIRTCARITKQKEILQRGTASTMTLNSDYNFRASFLRTSFDTMATCEDLQRLSFAADKAHSSQKALEKMIQNLAEEVRIIARRQDEVLEAIHGQGMELQPEIKNL